MTLANILIDAVVDILAGFEKILSSEDLLMFALTSKKIYSCLKKCPPFIFRILSSHLVYQMSNNGFYPTIEESLIIHSNCYPIIRVVGDCGDLRISAVYKTDKPGLLIKEKMEIAEAGDVSIYLKKHPLAKNLSLFQIETTEHLVFPNANIIKHEKWILFGKFEIVKKKVDILLKYHDNFTNNRICVITHL